MDPATITLLTGLGTNLLTNLFGGGQQQQQGPSQAQILALLERQRQEREASQRAWLIGGGLVAVGLVAFLVVSRK